MATPLTAIGKYAGVLMAVMCVLLMFAFVIGDPLMQYAGGGSGGVSARETRTVATWNGGQINEMQLDRAVVHRNVLAEFQQQVYVSGALDARDDGVEDLGLRVRPIELPRTREQGVEASVVRTKVFAEKAREAGMVVSDKMIVDYLRALGRDRVSNDQMRGILSRMNTGGGSRATIQFVFDLLREAMLANNYLASHTYVFRTILPEERWEDWKKLNERVVVEAAPLSIDDFIEDVDEPTDEELATFFDEYKDREPTTEVLTQYGNVELPSASPAFATPPRVKLVYLKADFNAVAEGLISEVTDAEVAAYYEANKESFVEADRALFGGADSLFGPDDLLSGDTEEPAEPTDGEDAAAEEPQAEMPVEEEPADEAAAEEEAQPSTEDEPTDNPLRQENAEESTTEPSTETEMPVEEEEEEEEADNTAQEDTASEQDESPAADEPDTKPYQPLEEVADEIRRRIANERAAERLQSTMDRVKASLDDAYVEYFDARLDFEAGDDAEAPEPPEALANLKPLAEAEQLELIEVDQARQLELRETEVGGSINADPSAQRPLPAWFLAFRPDDLDLYQPLLTYDLDGNRYLILVAERDEGETPALEDVRDQVVAAWKRSQAAELALERAGELAEAITPTGKSLADYFAGAGEEAPVDADAIEETDAFALMTIGQVAPSARQIPLRLSQPEPLVAPGPDLLQAVFALEAGEVGAELNHDHSIAYLLRIAQQIGTEDELRREFLRDGDRWIGAQTLMQSRATSKLGALLGNLLDESGLEWERTPDELR